MLVVFSLQDNLQLSILTLIVFSIFVQASEGTTYALVPYIKPKAMGGVSGIIGAGGNIGAICFGLFLGSSLRSVTHFGGRGGGGHCHRVESVGIAPALLRCVLAHPTHHRPHLLELGQEQLRVLQVATGAACDAHL